MAIIKKATVIEVRPEGTGYGPAWMVFRCDDGKLGVLYAEFKGYSPTLKVGERIRVTHKGSMFSSVPMPDKARRIKEFKLTLLTA